MEAEGRDFGRAEVGEGDADAEADVVAAKGRIFREVREDGLEGNVARLGVVGNGRIIEHGVARIAAVGGDALENAAVDQDADVRKEGDFLPVLYRAWSFFGEAEDIACTVKFRAC